MWRRASAHKKKTSLFRARWGTDTQKRRKDTSDRTRQLSNAIQKKRLLPSERRDPIPRGKKQCKRRKWGNSSREKATDAPE